MIISNYKIDWNLGNDFYFDRQDASLGHLFVRFKSNAKVLTQNGYRDAKSGNFIFYKETERTAYSARDGEFCHDFFRFYLSTEESERFDFPTSVLFTDFMPEPMEMAFRLIGDAFFTEPRYRDEMLDVAGRLFLMQVSVFAKSNRNDSRENRYRILFELRREILKAPQENWNIEELAQKAMLNPTYFQKLYKQIFGVSCIKEMIAARIKMAENLLLSTSKKETEIAFLCGYRNIEHFIRQFKKETGITPSAFRQKNSFLGY